MANQENNNRCYGIDCLKIVCMFYIVILHVLGHGGIIEKTELFSVEYEMTWLLKCFCLCAVNCYAMATGYLLLDKPIKLSRIMKLWLEVWIYSVLVSHISATITGNTISLKQNIMTFFPLLSKQYWYFSVYVGVFFMSPYLNLVVNKFSKKQLEKALITLVILVCLIPTVINFDLFDTPTGSLLWLCCLYILGAYIKKYSINIRKPSLVYLSSSFLMWFIRLGIELFLYYIAGGYNQGGYFIVNTYVSPLCLLSAIGLFFCMIQNNVKRGIGVKWVSKIAGMSFAVYLVHDNPWFKEYIWKGAFAWMASESILFLLGKIIVSGCLIFGVCILIEWIRMVCTRPIDTILSKIDKFNKMFEV